MEQNKPALTLPPPISRETDYTLLIKQLGKAVLDNPGGEKSQKLLATASLWHQLPTAEALEWADLAKIAGLPETALAVYARLTGKEPKNAAAWEAYIQLLDILDYTNRLSAAVTLAQNHLPKSIISNWISRNHNQAPKKNNDSQGLDAPVRPFVQMQTRHAMLGLYLNIFSGRQDVFARQWADKIQGKSGYVPVRRPMEKSDIEDHLKGTKTYGIYLMGQDASVRCGLIDADLVPALRGKNKKSAVLAQIRKEQAYMISRIKDASSGLGVAPLLEFSGSKGFHFWFFPDRPIKAALVRKVLSSIADSLKPDLDCFDLEVFPKQDHLSGKGLGNLVKLPLGIHRLSGKRSYFPNCIKKDIASQLAFLEQVKKIPAHAFDDPSSGKECKNLIFHPRMEAIVKEYPDLFELQRLCPPVGQIISLAREGRSLRVREEKILFQTLGFLPDAKKIFHYLLQSDPEYNPHMVDYKLSRLRGTPLGCRRIHSLTGVSRDFCNLSPDSIGYLHPLIHLKGWQKTIGKKIPVSEKTRNLEEAIEGLKSAILQVEHFLV